MTIYACTACSKPIPVGSAVLRGDLTKVHAWHRGCFTFHRATWDLEEPEVLGGTLTERLERLRETMGA